MEFPIPFLHFSGLMIHRAARPGESSLRSTADAPGGARRSGRGRASGVRDNVRPQGVTLEEVTARFGWQVHTTRALVSAGGALAKKHGITVISEKAGNSRTYRIAK
jgi:hypothetical protein